MAAVRLKLVVIPVLAACGWLAIQWLDWSRLLSFEVTGRWEEYLLSRRIKLLLSATVTLLVWTTGRAALSDRDRRLMRGAFGAVVSADIAFFLNNYHIGIGVFSIAQVLLIIRNASGMMTLARRGWSAKVARLLFVAVIVGVVDFLLLKVLFVPHAANPMFPVIAVYSLLLCCSLWAGIACAIIGFFPEVNSRLVAVGVGMLYLGDLTVGLNLILPHDTSYIISTSLTWFFYLPAITLLALSGYRWNECPVF